MPPATTARKIEPNSTVTRGVSTFQNSSVRSAKVQTLHAVPNGSRSTRENRFHFPTRMPVIIGEATYRGPLPVDGLLSGQLNGNGGALSVKQRTRNGSSVSRPELDGEIYFKDMVRVNGHIAGKVCSEKGTLIVSELAIVDACIDVGIAVINGTVNGDVIGHVRVELGRCAVINGNISSPSLTIKPGAVFQGQCRMTQITKVVASRERNEQQCFRFE